MSKINPDSEVEASAELARDSVLTVLWIKNRIVNNRQKTGWAHGAGFVIKSHDKGSIVMTANHVIGDMQQQDEVFVRIAQQDNVQQLAASVLYQHAVSDVALLEVPDLRNVKPLTFEETFQYGGSVIGVACANPAELFPGINMACKCIPDLSPGSVIDTEDVGLYQDVYITHLHLEMVSVKGMSGAPVLNANGVIGMIITGSGASVSAVSYNTILQVLKAYYKRYLRQAYHIDGVDIDALVVPWTMEQMIVGL